MDFLSYFLIALLDTLPYMNVQYMAMQKKLKIKKIYVYLSVSAILIALALGYAALANSPSVNSFYLNVYRGLYVYAFYCLPLIFTRENIFKIIFFNGLIFSFLVAIMTSSIMLTAAIGGGTVELFKYALIRLVLSALITLVTLFMWKRFSKDAASIDDKFFWSRIFYLPIILAFIARIFIPADFETGGISPKAYIGSILVCLLGFSIAYVSFVIAKYETSKQTMQERDQKMTLLLELQDQQYEQLAEQIERSRRARHDMRHHFNALKRYADKNDRENAIAYIENVLSEYSRLTPNINICENFAANAILSHFIEKARELCVPIKVRFVMSEDFHISDSDLCVLIGNAVENAIEAATQCEDGKRFIHINTSSNAGRFYIVFSNSFESAPRVKNGEYLSSKRAYKRSGVGISSIKAITEKYGGEVKIETEDNIFKLAIMIPEQ